MAASKFIFSPDAKAVWIFICTAFVIGGSNVCQKLKKSSLRLMSFLLSLLVASTCVFLSDKPVKAIAGVDDALFWAAFEATLQSGVTFSGTAGEAALTGKIAHDEYGVKFGSQSQAQDFVKDFFQWALQSGGPLALTPQGQIANAAGQAVFSYGYKALAPHSVAARSALAQALSLFIYGVKSGTIYAGVTPTTIAISLSSSAPAYNANIKFSPNTTYYFGYNSIITSGYSGSPYVNLCANSNSGYQIVYQNQYFSSGTNTVLGDTFNNQVFKVVTDASTWTSYCAGRIYQMAYPLSSSMVLQFYANGLANSTVIGGNLDVYGLVNGQGQNVGDYSGVSTSGTIAMPVAGSLNPSVPIGLGATTDSYPMNDVINGADTSYADEQAGELENVDASQLDAADAAEAEGDTAIDPANDWTKPKDGIDWTPLENLALTKKFPFSLPFDFYNLAFSLNVTGVAPQFVIPFHFPDLPDMSYTIDFSQYEWFVSKMRVFLYIVFLGIWIFSMYKVIKH